MPDQDWLFDVEFFESCVQHLRLHVDCNGMVIGTIAVAVARAVEGKSAVARCQRPIQPRPILTRTGIAVNQDYGATRAFDYEMQTRVADSNKFGKGLRILMSNARSEIALLESSGYVHHEKFPYPKGANAPVNRLREKS